MVKWCKIINFIIFIDVYIVNRELVGNKNVNLQLLADLVILEEQEICIEILLEILKQKNHYLDLKIHQLMNFYLYSNIIICFMAHLKIQ